MNRNRCIKVVSCAIAAGMVITGASLPVKAAAPVAGATAKLIPSEKVEAVAYSSTVLSGANRLIADAMTKTVAKEELQPTEKVSDTTVSVKAVMTNSSDPQEVSVLVSDIPEPPQDQGNDYEGIGIAQVDSCVNVRNAPSEEGEVIGKLYSNGAANVEGMEGDWYKVKSGNCDGYIKAEFLSVGDPEIIEAASKYIATVHADLLYLREDTSTESSVLEMLEDGAKLYVLDDSTKDIGWIKVKTNEGEGFVSADYVELSREFTYAESKEEEAARIAKEKAAAEAAAKAKKKSGGGSGGVVAPGGSGGAAVANFALQFVGNPYVYGGSSLTNGADCSGFVMAVYANFGVGLPHSSGADRSVGYGVDPSAMSPGDIVCYQGHVGIAIGGGQIVHASTPSSGIKVSSAYYKPILAVRRIF